MASKQLKQHRLRIKLLLLMLISVIFGLVFSFIDGQAKNSLPDFNDFISLVSSGESRILRGVYVPGVLALPIVQQPDREWGYVSPSSNQVTEFGMATKVGNIGLLAHNYLAGEWFSQLAPDQEVRLIYADGSVEYFVIRDIIRYQALEPTSVYGDFLDLQTGYRVTAGDVFNRVYRGERHVAFQTCIALNGDSSWGRLFVIAEPRELVPAD